jgi:hypothetical protein
MTKVLFLSNKVPPSFGVIFIPQIGYVILHVHLNMPVWLTNPKLSILKFCLPFYNEARCHSLWLVCSALGQTHSLTSFGCSFGSCDLAMCVAVKHRLYVSFIRSLCNFLFMQMFLKFYKQSADVCHVS